MPKKKSLSYISFTYSDDQNGTELLSIGNPVNIPAQPQNTAQPLEQKQSPTGAPINSVPAAVMNYKGSFLDTKSLARLAATLKNHHRIFREDKKGELRKRAVQQLLQYIVAPKRKDAPEALNKAEAMIKANLDLLLETGRIETYAKDLNGNPVIVEGTAFQLALAAEDDAMAKMIAKYLDEHYPGEKQKQYRAQFPNEIKEEKAEDFSKTPDGKALNTIINAITNASVRACELVLNDEENIPADDKEAQELLTALNAFRAHVTPKDVIKTGKHFNMSLLIEAFKLYDQNHDAFGGWDSHKNNLCWQKLIGYMQRFLSACYAQAFSQGIYYIIEDGEKLRRSFDFRFSRGSYFPLDPNPNFRLGYHCAVAGGPAEPAGRPLVSLEMPGGWWGAMMAGKLCQAKTAALQRIMQQPCNQSRRPCLVM